MYNQGTGGKTHQGKEGKSFKTERQPELGWDMTKFRMYDYALGRFLNVDPLADAAAQESLSPYHYVRNNPVNFNDPYGDCDWCLDALQTGLDVAGMVPAVGNVADLANAGISAARGDYVGMTLSLAAAVPGAGLVAGGAKLAKRAVNAAKTVDKASDVAKVVDKGSDLQKAQSRASKLSQKQRPGQDFTKAGKDATKNVNKAKNNGQMKCEGCGQNTQQAKQHTKGNTPPGNEAHVDHKVAKSKGGSGTPDNGQVLCRDCNLEKGAN